MKHFTTTEAIRNFLLSEKKANKSVGFVPTMGALHEGHIGLIKQAKDENDVVVCSIFVNPLQFNRKEDLESYPNRMQEDKMLLESVNCDFLFTPQKNDLFKDEPRLDYDFGSLGKGMEAEFRPGHFQGVAAVIECFFNVLNPTRAYFGEKDYQQLAIIRWLVEKKNFETKVIPCKTIRFENGLAMSSRNYNLAKEEFDIAADIYKWMLFCKENKSEFSPLQMANYCFEKLKEKFQPEYVSIVDEITLTPISNWSESACPRVFIAAYLSTVRLIDNLSLID